MSDLRGYDPDQNHNESRFNRHYNEIILKKSIQIVGVHGRACDLAIKTQQLFAHGVFELSYDVATLVHMAKVNKAT